MDPDILDKMNTMKNITMLPLNPDVIYVVMAIKGEWIISIMKVTDKDSDAKFIMANHEFNKRNGRKCFNCGTRINKDNGIVFLRRANIAGEYITSVQGRSLIPQQEHDKYCYSHFIMVLRCNKSECTKTCLKIVKELYNNQLFIKANNNYVKASICYSCNQPYEKLFRCSKCCVSRYCSKECQANDWPEHKKICIKKKD